MTRLDLAGSPRTRGLLQNRWPQFLLRAAALAGFLFTILAGLLGSPVGSHNFAIIFVWIAWWTALKLGFIPFGGRSWCSICPIPMPGEWLQNGGILRRRGRNFGLNKRWPRRLRGSWLQAGGFLLVSLFGAVTLTTPGVTAYVLLGVLALAIGLSLVFERRAFCSYLCPIGELSGLYAQAGPVEVRVKDQRVCAAHKQKDCYQACPWNLYIPALQSSSPCGLCMECLRACPYDNVAVNLRPWGGDLGPGTKHRLDEAFLGLVMLASALINSAVFLGPWGGLKTAAFAVGSGAWFGYAAACLGVVLLLAGLYAAAARGTWAWEGKTLPFKKALAQYSQVLVPLGLMAWIAFTVSFAFAKFSYVLPVLSDPFGWGWNLLGVAKPSAVGGSTTFSLYLQAILLAAGLFWSSQVARRIVSSARGALALTGFSGLFTLGMLWLLIG
jgi:hypothetical protein